jgi:UDP-N-acetylmuramate--alanine ligase
MNDFAKSFFYADRVFVTDIYPASESPIEGVDSKVLVEEMKKHGFKDAVYLENNEDFFRYIDGLNLNKSVIMTFGAGSITKFSFELAEYFKRKEDEK